MTSGLGRLAHPIVLKLIWEMTLGSPEICGEPGRPGQRVDDVPGRWSSPSDSQILIAQTASWELISRDYSVGMKKSVSLRFLINLSVAFQMRLEIDFFV